MPLRVTLDPISDFDRANRMALTPRLLPLLIPAPSFGTCFSDSAGKEWWYGSVGARGNSTGCSLGLRCCSRA
jgi:hypothetical protein